ncbi:MAG TPA: NAD(P)-dependent oxidoreductase [Planctomycetota bacterium]|nr:NAD(P)-dependent oxidoreductase [Planctomycetota bacterium]
MARIVLTHWVHDEVLDVLRRAGEVASNPTRGSLPRAELTDLAATADALMVFMPDRVDAELLDRCPRLRIVAGALKGCDNIDVDACTERGVWVTVVPDLLTDATADMAVGLMLAVSRRIVAGDALVRAGFPGWRPVLYGERLTGRSVGILGFGRLGRAVARRLGGFQVRIRHHDPRAEGSMPLGEMLAWCDHLVVAAPLTPSTRHMIDEAALARMKPGACLVNVGRGSVVDEEAVARAIETGHLAGYAADVYEMEDLSRADRPQTVAPALLALHEHTVLTPHLGSAVDEVRRDIALAAAGSILDALHGRPPRDAVNRPRAPSCSQGKEA